MSKILSDLDFGPQSMLFILGQQGKIVYTKDKELLGKPWNKVYGINIDKLNTSSNSYVVQAEGRQMLVCYCSSQNSGWTIISIVPMSNLTKGIRVFGAMKEGDSTTQKQIGLSNIYKRIKLLYNDGDVCVESTEGVGTEKREGQIIARAKQFINNHLSEQIALADISREVFISTFYLSHLFKEKTGMTFLEYLTQKRMEMAQTLLSNPRIKVYEVANKVGYSNWKHFSRTFKEFTGYGPAEYKQKRRIT
ncbi:MAG: helix-turn-helix domain-containing protein [Firmicutes bacterium]|nr:helix-turn-helix domain-containing protein [Bacillota bacterium]